MASKFAIVAFHSDWTRQEQNEINRIRAFCRGHPRLNVDGGQTDEDEPWCVVYDRQGEEVVLHIARIGPRYVVANPSQSILRRLATVGAAVDVVLNALACKTRQRRHDPQTSLPRTLVRPRA
jgi:hypothetical protein